MEGFFHIGVVSAQYIPSLEIIPAEPPVFRLQTVVSTIEVTEILIVVCTLLIVVINSVIHFIYH